MLGNPAVRVRCELLTPCRRQSGGHSATVLQILVGGIDDNIDARCREVALDYRHRLIFQPGYLLKANLSARECRR